MDKDNCQNSSKGALELNRLITNSEIWACQEEELCAVLYTKNDLENKFGDTKLFMVLKTTM